MVVKRDLKGTGKASIAQLVAAANGLTGRVPLTEIQSLAADLNGDGRVNVGDLAGMSRPRTLRLLLTRPP